MFNKYSDKKYHLYGGELFCLNFYGVNTFFAVCDTSKITGKDYIYIYEVETYEGEWYDSPIYDENEKMYKPKASKDCYFIPKNFANSFYSQDAKVYPIVKDENICFPLNVNASNPIVGKAKKYNPMATEYFLGAAFLAFKVADGYPKSILSSTNCKFIKETKGDGIN